jgi:tetratricopeptide (TPR) repeat protein
MCLSASSKLQCEHHRESTAEEISVVSTRCSSQDFHLSKRRYFLILWMHRQISLDFHFDPSESSLIHGRYRQCQSMRKTIFLYLLILTNLSYGQIMNNTFYTWDDFASNFGNEMVSAEDLYNSMKDSGLKDFTLSKFDYHFVSDDKSNLVRLNDFLTEHYKYEFQEYTTFDNLHELRGLTNEIPITKETLLYWSLDMAKRAIEFDCKLDGYGSAPDNKNPVFPDFSKDKEDFYFDKAVELYNNRDLGGAIINWTLTLQVNPKDPNSYYSRAIVKNELYTWKSALVDYDKAIEIAPNFIDAIVNRGSLKDENRDYKGAVEDYSKAIEIDKNYSMAYFNRGNTKFNLGNKSGACEDWKKAKELGDENAAERITKNCK